MNLRDNAEYRAWCNMKQRCYNKSRHDYPRYGGRGIVVCELWVDSFECFLNDMGLKASDELSLDRIDNNKGYNKKNCRWATPYQQANNKRNNILIEIDGLTRSILGWSDFTGLSYKLIHGRYWGGKRGSDIIKKERYGTYHLDGLSLTLKEWSEKTGIKRTTILQRISYKWSIRDALTRGAKHEF